MKRKEGKTNPKHNKSLEYLCCSLLKMRLTARTSTEDKPWRSIHTVFHSWLLWWLQFTLVTRRAYCPGRPKELCFTTLSLAMETMGMRLSVVKQSFFGSPGAIWPPCDKDEFDPPVFIGLEFNTLLCLHWDKLSAINKFLFRGREGELSSNCALVRFQRD